MVMQADRSPIIDGPLLILAEMASEFSGTTSINDLQRILSRRLRWLLDFDRCTLAVWAEPTDEHYSLYEITNPKQARQCPPERVALAEGGWPSLVMLESKTYLLDDVVRPSLLNVPCDGTHHGISTQARSLLMLPLRFGNRTLGSLNFSSNAPGTYFRSNAWPNLAHLLCSQLGGQLGSILSSQRTAALVRDMELAQMQLQTDRDLAAQKVEHLERQMQELHGLNRLKDDFLYTVSHELRAPLTNIKMAIRLLARVGSQSQRDRYLQILENECSREVELISDLLDLQRLEAGAKLPTLEVICLQDWLPQLLQPFQSRTQERAQRFSVQVPQGLSSLIADRSGLARILVELLNNACKYTPAGSEIMMRIRQSPGEGSETLVTEFTVSNRGPEIPANELEHIFEKFYRLPGYDQWSEGGSGLGLTLAKKLVEQLKGRIRATSNRGWTTFTVQLYHTLPR